MESYSHNISFMRIYLHVATLPHEKEFGLVIIKNKETTEILCKVIKLYLGEILNFAAFFND